MVALAIDTEATGLSYHNGCRAFMVIATDESGKEFVWTFPVDPYTRKVNYSKRNPKIKKTIANLITTVKRYKQLVFHNGFFDWLMLHAIDKYFSIDTLGQHHEIHDTMLLGHHYNSMSKRGLKDRALLHVEVPDDDERTLVDQTTKARKKAEQLEWLIGSKTNTPWVDKDYAKTDYWIPAQLAEELDLPHDHPWRTVCSTYGLRDTLRTISLWIFYKEALPQSQWDVYERHRHCIQVFVKLHLRGVHLLVDKIDEVVDSFDQAIYRFKRSLQNIVGKPDFNPDSSKQLSDVLFTDFKLPPQKYGKTGPSADKGTIEALLDLPDEELGDISIRLFLETLHKLRQATTSRRQLNTYHRYAVHNYIYSSFHQVGTSTVRISSSDPNVQNAGKKDNPFSSASHFKLREVFGPKPGRIWYAGDYDQFQIRIFATAANDEYLLNAFAEGLDCHNAVACKMFGVSKPTDLQRRAAKYVNFGIIFGAGAGRIESLSGVKGAYQLFVQQFPKVFEFLAQAERQARKYGYVYTLGGYRLRVPRERPYAGANYIIQGTEAEIVKYAMIDVEQYLTTVDTSLNMFLPVHDELVFDALYEEDTTQHLRYIKSIMESHSLALGIPASVDFKFTTTTWAAVEDYHLAG